MEDIDYEIGQIGVLSQAGSGWTEELNLISWNGRASKYDIRDWSPCHQKMGRGTTLSREELLALRDLLNSGERSEAGGRAFKEELLCYFERSEDGYKMERGNQAG